MGKNKRTRVEDVLSGKIKPGPRELVSLISEINPTARELASAETARRYALKSQLQSLLIRWYGSYFLAEAGEAGEAGARGDIVLLRHRTLDECACHAHVPSLDDEARAWVAHNWSERQAEEVPESGPARSLPELLAGESLLERARQALEDFDYDEAERCLRAACASAVEATEAGPLLLELLVDHLAQDEEALLLEPQLPPAVRQTIPCRVLLALAAARTGRVAQVMAQLRGVVHPRTAEVFLLAGAQALAQGEIELARSCLSRGGETHPGATELAAGIRDALRQRHAGDEARLAELVSRDDLAQAEPLAQTLLDRGVPSEVARQVLQTCATRQRSARIAALQQTARSTMESGSLDAAARALDELEQLGAPRPELVAQLAGLRALELQRAEQAEAEAVAAALARPDPAPGVLRFLALSAELRDKVRSLQPSALCEFAEEALAALGSRRSEDALAAARTLQSAQDRLDARDWSGAERLLKSGGRDLERIPLAGLMLERARYELGQITLAGASEAWEALQEDRLEEALELWTRVTLEHWPADPRQRQFVSSTSGLFTRLSERLATLDRALRQHATLREIFLGLLEAQEFLRSFEQRKKLAAEKAADAQPTDREDRTEEQEAPLSEKNTKRWVDQQEQLRARLNSQLHFESYPVADDSVVEEADEQNLNEHVCSMRISEDGTIFFFACPGQRCHVTETNVRLRVLRRFSFRLGPGQRVFDLVPAQGRLLLLLQDGSLLALDRTDPRQIVVVGVPPDGFAQQKEPPALLRAEVLDDGWHALLHLENSTSTIFGLYDLGTGALLRNFYPCAAVTFLQRCSPPLVLVTGDKRGNWSVMTLEGRQVAGPEKFQGEFARFAPICGAQLAEGAGWLLLALDALDVAGQPGPNVLTAPLYLLHTDAGFRPITSLLVNSDARYLSGWLHILERHAIIQSQKGAMTLLDVFDIATLKPLLSTHVPFRRHLALRTVRHHHLTFELANDRYLLPDAMTTMNDLILKKIDTRFPCEGFSARTHCAASIEQSCMPLFHNLVDGKLFKASTGFPASPTQRTRKSHFDAAHSFNQLDRVTLSVFDAVPPETALHLVSWPPEQDPEQALPFFSAAELALTLTPGDPSIFEQLTRHKDRFPEVPCRTHARHLLGLAHLQVGDREKAVEIWSEGLKLKEEAGCPLLLLIQVAGGLTLEQRREHASTGLVEGLNPLTLAYEEAVQALREFDEALASGRSQEAWAAVRRAHSKVGMNWQLAARFVTLYLEHPELPEDPWRRRLHLEWFASGAWHTRARRHMVFPGLCWDWKRMTDLEERAKKALEG